MPYPTNYYNPGGRIIPGSVPPATTGVGAYGGIPQLPDPTQTAAGAIAGNTANLPGIGALAGGITDIGNRDAMAGYLANLPNYAAMTGQASGNALSNLQGIVPPDVIRQIQQAGAERGVAMGGIDSPNANAAMLRALGLTSLDLQNTGLNQFNTLYHDTPLGPQFNPASMLVTPDQEQSAAAMQGIYNAAPNPDAAAAAALHNAQLGIGAGGGGAPTITGGPPGPSGIRQPTTPSGPGEVAANSLATGNAPWKTSMPMPASNSPSGNPYQGPLINPGTGASTPFQGPAMNPWTGAASGGFQGPAINPWTGAASGGFQGPAIDPWSGAASGGFEGPAIDPWTGEFTGTGSASGTGMVTPGTDLYIQLQDLGIPDAELWSVQDAQWLLGDTGNANYGDGFYTLPGESNTSYFEDLGNQATPISDSEMLSGVSDSDYTDYYGDSP